MSKISIIAAIADNYAIGKSNKLPWYLPADLKHFRQLTTGHAVLMGRLTFESLPSGPLPNRKNIVLTSGMSEGVNEGFFEADSLADATYLCENEEQVFIIGGASVFSQCIDQVNTMYVTWVHSDFEGDTFFPEIKMDEWQEISREDHDADELNIYSYSFVVYERKLK